MSLELAIQQNTAAIEKLIGLLSETLPQPVVVNIGEMPPVSIDEKQTEAPKAKRAKKETAPVGEPVSEPSAPALAPGATVASETVAAAAPAADAPTYGEVAPYVTRVAKEKGKAAVLGLLEQFKATHFSQVDSDDYAAVLAAAKEILGE